MPFRKVTYKVSCAACPQLTEDLCRICEAPACSTHLGAEMCTHCGTAFAETLAAANLSFDDLKFGTPPDDDASYEEMDAWNQRAARAYKARFLVARLRKSRRRFSGRAKEK